MKLDDFKKDNTMEIIEDMNYFYIEPGDYSLSNEIFVDSIFDDHTYYDPKMIKLYKCKVENSNEEIAECYAVGIAEPYFTDDIEWLFVDSSFDVAANHFKTLKDEKECKEEIIDSLESWENSINQNLENGYVEIKKLPIQQHGFFAKLNIFSNDNELIASNKFTTEIEELQKIVDESIDEED